MKLTGNTILITGGGSGIGRALAEDLAEKGNKVIITGRRQELLTEVAKGSENITGAPLDIDNAEAIAEFATQVVKDFPELNVIINNAGIMRVVNIKDGNYLADEEATITTNVLGPIRLISALLPQLLEKESAAIVNVSSGLAFVPLTATPAYSASKAALHSYSLSLREQLKDTSVEVIEIAPPGVQTDMTGGDSNADFMPLSVFIDEVISLLEQPGATDIYVEHVKPLRFAEKNGNFDAVFNMINGSR